MGRQSSVFQPRKKPQQVRSRRTWDRTLAAAAHVFAENGYASTTTDQIAKAAGLSIGSLYQYFPNKDAVLHVLAMDHINDADAQIKKALGAAVGHTTDVSIRDWLRPVIDTLINIHAASPNLHRVIFDEAPRTPELLTRFTASQAYAIERVAALLRSDADLVVDSPERTAVFVVATLESLTHRFISSVQAISHHDLADELKRISFAYISSSATRR